MATLDGLLNSSSSEGENAAPQTPQKLGQPSGYNPVPERKTFRKPKRSRGISVLEINDDEYVSGGYKRLADAHKREQEEGPCSHAAFQALDRLCAGFGDDYFVAPNVGQPHRALAARAAGRGIGEAFDEPHINSFDTAVEHFPKWLGHMQKGFSLLVQGVGSKFRLLEHFADKSLLPWGAAIVRMNGFHARFSLAECLREALEHLHPSAPRTDVSAEALASALGAARRAAPAPLRPLCLVVHNLELLQQNHQATLATLSSLPFIHLVASVDNVFASLAWTSRMQRNFNFYREEVHTYEAQSVESQTRYPGGLPLWCDPFGQRQRAPKATLGLVMRSLTNSHREIMQAMAEYQLSRGVRAGMSTSALLEEGQKRMIASNITGMRKLLKELQDHELIHEKEGPDSSKLYYLKCNVSVLEKLAAGQPIEDSEDEASDESEKM